jgi:lysophospholipase L1-like esterase
MNYQNLLCVGDSQTFGARTYGCFPLHLARILTAESAYAWRTINSSANGATARDLWFRLVTDLETVTDTRQACLLIGTNDAGEGSDPDLFAEYYRQILRAFFVKKYKAVWCGEIPPIHADGHVYFARASTERRATLNARIEAVVGEFAGASLVRLAGLDRDCYVDPVHFNERGNERVARCFADAILAR